DYYCAIWHSNASGFF
nr:immunoglobulin light chain junction region [Macaca mulatta]MOY10038.1 immunoglobulin light chain junction region [Macaca mulatta]